MTTLIFPTLAGEGWSSKQTVEWSTSVQEAASGKETAVAMWSYPRYQFELNYEFLRSDPVHAEFQALKGFFNSCGGRAVPFLYDFADDRAVVGQSIGVGDGQSTAFQLVRACGGYVEPVFAPNAVSSVKINGVVQAPASYTIGSYDSASPGIVTFGAAPALNASITADFTFYFVARFLEDKLEFENFLYQLWKAGKVPFRTVK